MTINRREMLAALSALGACGCGIRRTSIVPPGLVGQAFEVSGAGATSTMPLYEDCIDVFNKEHKPVRSAKNESRPIPAHVRYSGGGSEAGEKLVKDGRVDFAGSDWPIEAGPAEARFYQIPIVAGAVVLIHNVRFTDRQGKTVMLNLSPNVIAGIHQGKIGTWDDEMISNDNPGVKVPTDKIVPIYRSDGSGTTRVYSTWANAEAKWPSEPGFKIKWPTGTGAAYSSGVAQAVYDTPGALGYVEYRFAVDKGLTWAAVQNRAGQFVRAVPESISAAIPAKFSDDPTALAESLLCSGQKDAYPISFLTWLLVPADHPVGSRRALREFLDMMLGPAQIKAPEWGYVPLPDPLLERARGIVKQI